MVSCVKNCIPNIVIFSCVRDYSGILLHNAMEQKIQRKARPEGKRTKKNASKKMNAFLTIMIGLIYFRLAAKYSLFMRAMFSSEIPFGHSISQAPVLVQFPKPSSSI